MFDSNYLTFFHLVTITALSSGIKEPKEWIKYSLNDGFSKIPDFLKKDEYLHQLCCEFFSLEKGTNPKNEKEIQDWLNECPQKNPKQKKNEDTVPTNENENKSSENVTIPANDVGSP